MAKESSHIRRRIQPLPRPTPPPPPPAPPSSSVLTPGNVALFAFLLIAEAVLLTALLRRVQGPLQALPTQDLSRQEYVDLDTTTVAVRTTRAGSDVTVTIRVEASLLIEGDAAERARARDAVRNESPKIKDEIGKTVGALNADQALDPGNRERLKDRLKSALNTSVFREDLAKEVVLRYYGP